MVTINHSAINIELPIDLHDGMFVPSIDVSLYNNDLLSYHFLSEPRY